MSSASSPPAVAAAHGEGHLSGRAGKRLYWQSWLGSEDPRAVVVIAHGGAEHGGRYRYVVERLVPEGFAVYAIDHRGHGRSEGARAQIDRLAHVVADLDLLVDVAHAAHPGRPLFLLGHSMGGLIAIEYTLHHQDRLAGLALSAPVAAIDDAPLPLRLIARLLSVATPGLGVFQVEAGGVSRDPEEVRAYIEDPLVFTGRLPARTVQEIAEAVARFPGAVGSITIPLLVMIGDADRIVAPAGGRMVHERAGSSDKTLCVYEGFFHELFNEPAGERDRPLGDLARWLAEHVD